MHFKCGVLFNIKLEGVFTIVKFKHYIAPVALGILTTLFATNEAHAAEVTVKNDDELWDILEDITENTKIIIDPSFQSYGGDGIYLNIESKFDVEIDANNVNFLGKSTIVDDSEGDIVVKNFLIDGSKGTSEYEDPGLDINTYEPKGNFIIKDSTFSNMQTENGAPLQLGGSDGKIVMENILVENNNSLGYTGTINIDSPDLLIDFKNSTFLNNNANDGAGVILSRYGYKQLNISNSKFIDNTLDLGGESNMEGAGVIYAEEFSEVSKTTIKDSIFHNNSINNYENAFTPVSGAISFGRFKATDALSISGTTFSENVGSGGGGAISIKESESAATNLDLQNNTFYKNSTTSLENGLVNGGAIVVYNEVEEEGGQASENKLFSKNNTFIENEIIRNGMIEMPEDVKGGAIGMKGNFMKHEFQNDLFVGNKAENYESNSKLFSNINLSSTQFTQKNTMGFDNGTETKDTVAQAYGKYPVVLAENGSNVKAGRKEDATIIPTIMIAPKLVNVTKNQTTGFANMTGANATEKDQRGNKRLGKPDIGAVEISSVVYDSNGGEFTLAELTKYDGKTYYEGKNPQQYAKVNNPGAEYTIIDGMKVLKPTKKGYTFLGWSNVFKPHSVNAKYKAGSKHKVDDQLVLYAVWKKDVVSMKYYSNGKTSGTIPVQKNVVPNSSVTIKTVGKMKRKGYKFSGWSTKPSAKKGEAAYAPGKKLKLVKNTKLYAIWNR